ncbi:MAG TPA: DUF5677 domain-containing protein [Candidatus Sulfotelmatobacter sp.]|nr:DUF5677 domain-containing protein [Candidatus Sulfotelmatobacter sp.]
MQKPSKESQTSLRRLNKVLNKIHGYLDAQWFHPRQRTYLDVVVLTFLSKSIALARSTCCLVQHGFDEEAFASSRTLLELALNLRYITNGRNPEVRARRFVHFVAKIKMEWGRKAVEHFAFPVSTVRKGMPSYKAFQGIERKFPKQGWLQASRKHSKGIWTMAMEPDRFEKQPLLDRSGKPVLNKHGKPTFKPFTWAFDYKVIYFWTSQFVHVTIDSLDNHSPMPNRPFNVYSQGSRPPVKKTDLGDMALFNTIVYMHRILLAGFRAIGHSYPDKLSKPITALMESFVNQGKAA